MLAWTRFVQQLCPWDSFNKGSIVVNYDATTWERKCATPTRITRVSDGPSDSSSSNGGGRTYYINDAEVATDPIVLTYVARSASTSTTVDQLSQLLAGPSTRSQLQADQRRRGRLPRRVDAAAARAPAPPPAFVVDPSAPVLVGSPPDPYGPLREHWDI